MIVGNSIYFGYGDIIVKTDLFYYRVLFQQMNNPLPIGCDLHKARYSIVSEKIVSFSYADLGELNAIINWLERMLKGDDVIRHKDLKGIELNFENFSYASVEIVLKHLKALRDEMIRFVAC